jgi:NAD(P)H dehydrogenase (quinone)
MPVGKGRHSPIAADDQGRAIAALLKNPGAHIGTTIPISGPVEMDHEEMAAELSEALNRKIVFQDLPIGEYCALLEKMGVPAYVIQHLSGAMLDYQNGHMAGSDNNVEKLTGRRSMTVGEFALAHADVLNATDTKR